MLRNPNFKPLFRGVDLALLCISISMTISACSSENSDKESNEKSAAVATKPQSKKVRVHTLSTRRLVDRRSYAADLEASTEITLYPLMAERIVSFPFEDGDRVKARQIVARIRAAGVKKGIAQMQAELESLDRTLENQDRELKRSKELYNTQIITQQSLEQIEAGYSSALAKRKALEASLGQTEVNAGNAVLRSPVSGFVINKLQEEGDTAQPGRPLCSIVCVDPIRVTLGITSKDLPAIRKGMKVELTVEAVPNRVFMGEVVRILPILDTATRTNEARIEISNPVDENQKSPLLKPGMFGRVSILVSEKEDQLVVPSRALMVADDASSDARKVFVVDKKGIAHERTVRVGVRNDAWYEVLSGLDTKDRVVLRGQYSLRDKDAVQILGELKLNDKGEAER